MPHITIESFDTSRIVSGDYGETKLLFIAQDFFSDDEMLGVEIGGETFLLQIKKLQIKKSDSSWLLKYDKLTRPLDVNLVKQTIGDISTAFDLKVLNSNININKSRASLANAYEKGIEDFIDIEDAKESLAEPGKNIPATEFWKQIGL